MNPIAVRCSVSNELCVDVLTDKGIEKTGHQTRSFHDPSEIHCEMFCVEHFTQSKIPLQQMPGVCMRGVSSYKPMQEQIASENCTRQSKYHQPHHHSMECGAEIPSFCIQSLWTRRSSGDMSRKISILRLRNSINSFTISSFSAWLLARWTRAICLLSNPNTLSGSVGDILPRSGRFAMLPVVSLLLSSFVVVADNVGWWIFTSSL